uniref:Outer dense fiber protein 3 n=1 Tax=Alexandrium monilatum TaxID=311494 RepID=A0A7S4Q8E9_9DINO|mmetsp:Transcript_1928/g.6394  ORF Transcript_1928/g.6394 Transcript_1928/m.6394 type:complete len:225 (+) Transcript_1928:230-904(+)
MGEVWNYASHSSFKTSPKYSFTSAPGASDKKHGVPGPGQYGMTATDKDKFGRSASWTMGASTRDGGKGWGSLPGPGAYTPSNTSQISPKWGFGAEGRLRERKVSSTPGPGAYETRSKGLGGLEMSISSKPDGARRAHTPGPGSYKPTTDPCSHMPSAPRVSFGGSTRSDLMMSKTPGPGAYEHLTSLGGNVAMRTTAKYSIKGRYKQPSADITPGPCNTGTQFR